MPAALSANTRAFFFPPSSPAGGAALLLIPLAMTILDAFSGSVQGWHTASSTPPSPPPVPQSAPDPGRMSQGQLRLGAQAPGMVPL
uniref:Uncharacterized protein n=1 Tax=Arundo donax TaxID=35708 RepID=A0A0A9B802_ARUDO